MRRFDPPGMRFDGMSQAVRCGDVLFVSGQVALSEGQLVGEGDAAAQAKQCFANIEVVLTAAGADLSHVASLRCSLTRRDAYEGYVAVRNARFGADGPASTVVIVSELLVPGLLMEVEAVAWLGDERPAGD